MIISFQLLLFLSFYNITTGIKYVGRKSWAPNVQRASTYSLSSTNLAKYESFKIGGAFKKLPRNTGVPIENDVRK